MRRENVKMRANELIGKNAIRTQPVYDLVENGFGIMSSGLVKKPDYRFTTEPIKIIKATEYHILAERKNYDGSIKQELLNSRYCDENWVDYDELMDLDGAYKIQQNKIKRALEIGYIFVK
jgi:hypothetical protein